MNPWHEDDVFWETAASAMFSERSLLRAPAEVEAIVALLGIEPGASVLDLCCGVGRHSLELARRGFRVTAVDRTQLYLERASERAKAEGLQVEFVQEDMRNFCREGAYDAVVNLFTSFGYFEDPEDDRRVASNVYRSLKPGGTFLLEMMGKEVLARIFLPRDWQEMDDGTLMLQERKVTRDWSWMENRWIFVRDGVRTELPLSHRVYSAVELSALLKGCGFARSEVYGDLGGAPYDHTARRLAVVAQRSKQ